MGPFMETIYYEWKQTVKICTKKFNSRLNFQIQFQIQFHIPDG